MVDDGDHVDISFIMLMAKNRRMVDTGGWLMVIQKSYSDDGYQTMMMFINIGKRVKAFF